MQIVQTGSFHSFMAAVGITCRPLVMSLCGASCSGPYSLVR
jgi:hypothetical protein